MYKFEMTIGWLGNGKITVDTKDFDVIKVLKEFAEYQESNDWMGDWDAVDKSEEEVEEEVEDEEDAI